MYVTYSSLFMYSLNYLYIESTILPIWRKCIEIPKMKDMDTLYVFLQREFKDVAWEVLGRVNREDLT